MKNTSMSQSDDDAIVRVALVLRGKLIADKKPSVPFWFENLSTERSDSRDGEMPKEYEIVEMSLLPYPVRDMWATPNGDVAVILEGPSSEFREANTYDEGDLEGEIIDSLEHNYEDGAGDGWMGGDIDMGWPYELSLELLEIEVDVDAN